MYNTKILNSGFYEQFPNDLTFNYMMILAHKYYNHKVKFFSILWQEQDQISNVKMLRQTISILKMLFKYMFNKRKFMNWKPENNIQNLYDYNIKKIHEL